MLHVKVSVGDVLDAEAVQHLAVNALAALDATLAEEAGTPTPTEERLP